MNRFQASHPALDNGGMGCASKTREREYRLYHTFASATLPLIALVANSTAGLLLLVVSAWNGRLLVLGGIVTAVAFAFWFHVSSVTWRIMADETTGNIDFIGLLTKRCVHATQFVSIIPDQAYGRNLVVALQSGRPVPLYKIHFDGFHDFLTWLKRANPRPTGSSAARPQWIE
ncbi:MAG TPA: hypothetical protein VFB96_05745 [Pirellulaceae bacterium]|nr:hypothetical protein [Pirellulaceae bacterium]